jgi:hypothetical protein
MFNEVGRATTDPAEGRRQRDRDHNRQHQIGRSADDHP